MLHGVMATVAEHPPKPPSEPLQPFGIEPQSIDWVGNRARKGRGSYLQAIELQVVAVKGLGHAVH